MRVCTHVYTHDHAFVDVYVYTLVYMHAYTQVCTQVYTYVYTHVYAQDQTKESSSAAVAQHSALGHPCVGGDSAQAQKRETDPAGSTEMWLHRIRSIECVPSNLSSHVPLHVSIECSMQHTAAKWEHRALLKAWESWNQMLRESRRPRASWCQSTSKLVKA